MACMYNFNDISNIGDVDKVYNRDIHKYMVDRASLRNRVTVHNLIERYKSRNYFGLYMCQVLRRVGINIKKMFKTKDEANRKDTHEKVKGINKRGVRGIQNRGMRGDIKGYGEQGSITSS